MQPPRIVNMRGAAAKSTDGEEANAPVCKTGIHGFKSHSVLQSSSLCIYGKDASESYVVGGRPDLDIEVSGLDCEVMFPHIVKG